MTDKLVADFAKVINDLYEVDLTPTLVRADEKFGDFACNVAMQLASKVGKSPRDIANEIVPKLLDIDTVASAEVAGPGFINIRLSDQAVYKAMFWQKPEYKYKVVAEYSDPNPFKVLHAGHLYTTLVGDSIANIIEWAGAEVYRTNFGGDVGLHVAKAMWAILREINNDPAKLEDVPEDQRPQWISDRYVEGNSAYESDEQAKAEIIEINKKVYTVHESDDHDSDFATVYWTTRGWSYDGFKYLYDDLRVKPFDKYYPESQTTPLGLKLANQALTEGVLTESDGAVVFAGEEGGLHTRVFINSAGLPTYEAKDLGLNKAKIDDYNAEKNIIITGNDIIEYMKVVLRVASHFYPDIETKTIHLTHGMVKLPGGKKMSSRAGDVVLADDIIKSAFEVSENKDPDVVLGAIRYSFLKVRIGGDIIYDPEQSVSMEGNSGPYLQYALVRARSILRKLDTTNQFDGDSIELDKYERRLAFKLSEMSDAVQSSIDDLSPHHICNYLYELAGVFNQFYENSRVVDDPRSDIRGELVGQYEKTLATGLELLGMPTPEKM